MVVALKQRNDKTISGDRANRAGKDKMKIFGGRQMER